MARNSIQNANASLVFNGSATVVTTNITPLITGFNFSIWLKIGNNLANRNYVSWSADAVFSTGFRGLIDFPTNNMYVGLSNSGGGGTQFCDLDQATSYVNKWTHIVFTHVQGQQKIYANGVLEDTTVATMIDAPGQTVTLGRNSHSASQYLNGNMSNFVFQNSTTPWTQKEVTALYQQGTIPSGATMVLPLSEGAGSIAYDTSGNGNNGTITSPTWTRDAPSKTRKTVNGNLVYNGDFEIAPVVNVAQTTAYKWYDGTAGGNGSNTASVNTNRTTGIYYWDKGGSGSILLDDTVKKSGSYSLKLSTTATGSYTTASLADFNRDDYIPVLPSTNYTYSLWMKTNYVSGDATSGAGLNFRQFTGARSFVSSSGVSPIKTTTDWTLYTGTVTTAATTRFVAILPYVIANDGAATLIMDAWFDDITLTPTTATTRTATTGPYRKTVENLVANGDFEYAPAFTAATTSATKWIDGTAGSANTESPYGWWTPGSFTASATAQFDTTVCHSGTTSLKLSTLNATGVANAASGNNNTSQTIQKTVIRALPGTSYTLTGWVKTNNANTNSVYLDVIEYGGNNSFIASTSTNKLSGTNDWTQLTTTFTTSAVSTRYILIVLRNAVAGNISDAYFDDIVLTKTTPDARSAA